MVNLIKHDGFIEFLYEKLGTHHWVVSHHLTKRMKNKGYEKSITQKKFNEYIEEFNSKTQQENENG